MKTSKLWRLLRVLGYPLYALVLLIELILFGIIWTIQMRWSIARKLGLAKKLPISRHNALRRVCKSCKENGWLLPKKNPTTHKHPPLARLQIKETGVGYFISPPPVKGPGGSGVAFFVNGTTGEISRFPP